MINLCSRFVVPLNESTCRKLDILIWTSSWLNLTNMLSFPCTIQHLLQLIFEAIFIFWYSMCLIHLFCCHNALFFVSEQLSFSSNCFCCKPNHFSNSFLLGIYNIYLVPQVFQRINVQYQEQYIKGSEQRYFGTPNFLRSS